MSSLSTNAGLPRKANFYTDELRYGTWRIENYLDGVFSSAGPPVNRWSDQLVDIYYGKDLTNFHKRKAQGELLPFTDYVKLTHSISTSAHYKLIEHILPSGKNHTNEMVLVSGAPDLVPLWVTGSDNWAFDIALASTADLDIANQGIDPFHYVQQAASSLYSRGWDAGTFLAELGKTYQLIENACTSLLRLVYDWRKFLGSLEDAIDSQHYLPLLQPWLEARYGWRLLLYDIADIQETIWRLEEKARQRTKIRKGAEFSWIDDKSRSWSDAYADYVYSDVRTVTLNVRGSIIADFTPAAISFNPAVTAWEAYPYSFVIDWFIGIGQWIKALSFLALNDQYTACIGYSYTCSRVGSLSWTDKPPYVFDLKQEVDQSYEYFRRDPRSVSTIPLVSYQLDLPKVIDLIGLIGGIISGKLLTSPIR